MLINSSGYVGIGATSPMTKLHLREDEGDLKLRLQSDAGNEVQFYDINGNFEASVGYSKSQGHLYLYQGGNVAVKGGKLGVGTITPSTTLDVNGSARIGPSGVKIGEIMEINGFITGNYGIAIVNYPTGYNMSNTRILSAEYFEVDDAAVELWDSKDDYQFLSGYMIIDFPDAADKNEKFRAILMRVDP
jgi:hypothetical protein